MNIKEVPKKYRPLPFWSWNEKLDTEETVRQIQVMDQVGMGGFFMHARGGLQTPYVEEEWFQNVDASVWQAKQTGQAAWAYDENGWPSGFGDDKVSGLGIEYQQKYLRVEHGEKTTPQTIANIDGFHFYYDVNPFYVDTLDEKVIRTFLEKAYQPYYYRYQNGIEGFFTDEPQISRDGIPWSFGLPAAYQNVYGVELLPRLRELFEAVGDYQNTRIKFWKLVTDLFSKNFAKQIYDWCEARGLKLTGHLVLEEGLEMQLTSNGACMPHYEYFHIPGQDWLGREITSNLAQLQVGSVAQQLGKKQVLTESFALCGHNVSFSELRGILEWQMVRGITLLCPHLEGYSLRGIRKRDYPPAMYEQQPWWEEYSLFVESMSRIGMILTEGEVTYDTLLIHPQTTAWTCFDCGENKGLTELEQQLADTTKALDQKHILFHLGDETLMERHAKIEDGALVMGTQRYKTVVLMPGQILLDGTRKLLEAFMQSGGIVTEAEALAENGITDSKEITYTTRKLPQGIVYYFVNSTDHAIPAKINCGTKRIDPMTGELCPFNGTYDFAPFDSLLVLDENCAQEEVSALPEKALPLDGAWDITAQSDNALTLDTCDYYFDGVLEEKDGYVLNIQNRALALKRPVQIKQVYRVLVKEVPKTAYLVCETPEMFSISVNGAPLWQKDCGFFRDRSFRRLDLAGLLKTGENEIVFETLFQQSEQVYHNLKQSYVFESQKNKLTYDMEIEPAYLVGDFSVETDGEFTELDRDALRYRGGFAIAAPKPAIGLKGIEQQGYPFFSGRITVEKLFELSDTNYTLNLSRSGINAVRVRVNGGEEQVSIWNHEKLDLSPWLKAGENTIELTLINNLRNLMGPHHLKEGECYWVVPASFFKETCVWAESPEATWDDGYCFVKTGLEY